MARPVIMPKQGLQMTEGTILRWLKGEGDAVSAGEPLFEMETDKLSIGIDSRESGTLLKILKREGETAQVAEVIAVIGERGEDVGEYGAGAVAEDAISGKAAPDAGADRKRALISPRAAATAARMGIDISLVKGSGQGGMIVERDIAASEPPAPKPYTPPPRIVADHHDVRLAELLSSEAMGEAARGDSGDDIAPLTGMRRLIAARMAESLRSMAQARHAVHVDMSEAKALKDRFEAAGAKIGYNVIVILCAARALKAHPGMNASFTDNGIVRKGRVNVGMAVAVEGGLVVPVIEDADAKPLMEIAADARALAQRARDGTLSPGDMEGGTFTVTNLGMYGIDEFTAIINPPEAGILAAGAVKDRVVAANGEAAVRPMMTLTLSYDHRAIDGAPAAEFLSTVKGYLECPLLML